MRQLAASKGKNISIFGNCKGNILVDEVADLTKTEGTSEAGVWDGKWVHNIAQARFYYASGYGVKSYESKYEGADPGVPNPGAHDVRDGMKAGWKKPIAEVGDTSLRRADVFFYGLFMDEELLRAKGLKPEGAEHVAVDGFALRIGQRAALVPTPGGRVHGLVFSLTLSELDRVFQQPQAITPTARLPVKWRFLAKSRDLNSSPPSVYF